jgi:hypothetical protein
MTFSFMAICVSATIGAALGIYQFLMKEFQL